MIGVRDDGNMSGVRSEEEIYMMHQAAYRYCSPQASIRFDTYHVDGRTIVVVTVPPSDRRPVCAINDEGTKKAYIRIADENIVASPVHLALWRASQNPQGTMMTYTNAVKKILEVSVADLKRNYDRLDVHFDLWKSESDAQPYIPGVIEELKNKGLAHMDQGALVVDVSEETDKKEIPPCIILKSDGASLYSTTDIATIVERVKLFDPDEIIYVVDKRQGMHFEQVFRVVRKAGIVKPETELLFAGFGTMNGKDGKPFKTRDGGVMRLESLLNEIEEEMTVKIRDNKNVRAEDAADTAAKVALAAVKYGDLSNQASKDYIFDTEKFTSFEGNTGPYILYTLVRIKSILEKADAADREALPSAAVLPPAGPEEKALMLALTDFGQTVLDAYEELAPHRLCAYIYRLSNECNRFYHAVKILAEEDAPRRQSYLKMLSLAERVLAKSIDLLGFTAPDHM